MQDLKCSDESSTEDSSCYPSVTSVSDVITHVTDDVREFRAAVDSGSESGNQRTMTSTTSRHVTSNSNLRSPIRPPPSSSSSLRAATASQDDVATNLRQTSPTTKISASYLANARIQKNLDGAVDDRAGRMDCSVQDLEKMLNQVEASERQAWSWLESLDAENSDRVGELRQYITSMEQNKRQTSEAIAQLLQIECDLRQQISRKRSAAAGLLSSDPDDAVLGEVSRSLRNIVGRLQTQHGSSLTQTNTSRAEHSAGLTPPSVSRYPSTGSQAAAAAGFSIRNQNGGSGGIESDEGYDGNSNSLRSDSLRGQWDAEATSARVAALESEVIRLTRLLDAYRWSHGSDKSTERRSTGELGAPPGYLDASLHQAQADLRRLQSRVSDMETEKLELERELNKATSKQRDELEKLQTKLQLQKNESNLKISELKDVEADFNRTTKELKEQLDFEKEKRQCLEKKLLDAVESRDEVRQQLQETGGSLSGLRERLEVSEQSNKQLVAQVNFLTKTNESLMEDIDDNNERMCEELTNCRQGRADAELRCTELQSRCEKLTETVGILAERARALETSLEDAEKDRVECERLRHEHGVLVASEEKLVDKITDKDDMVKRLMGELADCKTSLEEQNHKIHVTNIALESYKDEGSRYLRELEDTRDRQKEIQESERQLMVRVRELEMSEAVLTTKLSAVETEKDHCWRVEADLKCELEDSRRGEKELLEKVASLERRESTLQEKVEQSESRATHLVELLRNTQEMSLHQQLRSIYDVANSEDDVDDDDVTRSSPAFHRLPDSTSASQSAEVSGHEASGYGLERTTKVELLTKVYQLERKCFLQRNKIHDLTSELSAFRHTVAEANHRQMDTVLPALVSSVENKVLLLLHTRVK